ncbi:uncharacterized protein G2W53_029818 [Senna tora]|uniref:Uncharacterized protein n=1 Tax=Senna tora TaxID=362788 RepID=A0A834TES0_9FABA|nr:uncharacterized protein G2W53_029818 [Senna tora]
MGPMAQGQNPLATWIKNNILPKEEEENSSLRGEESTNYLKDKTKRKERRRGRGCH